jgi:hypothetical protein
LSARAEHGQETGESRFDTDAAPTALAQYPDLEEKLYTSTSDIADYVLKTFGVVYSVRGLTKWLKQHGFTYHKLSGVPAKADGEAQKAWIAWYEKFKNSLQDNEKLLFMDGAHPTHAVCFACGWIRKRGPQRNPDQWQPKAPEHSRRAGFSRPRWLWKT